MDSCVGKYRRRHRHGLRLVFQFGLCGAAFMSVRPDVVTVRHHRVASGAGHGLMVPMMGGHFAGLLGRAVQAVVLATERERARRDHQV